MAEKNIFITALSQRLRFPYKGNISTEDLFSLSLDDLDTLYKSLNAKARDLSGDGLVKKANPASSVLETQLAVIREVFEFRQAEINAKKAASEKRQKNARIRELIAEKRNEALKNMSIEDLEKLLDGGDE